MIFNKTTTKLKKREKKQEKKRLLLKDDNYLRLIYSLNYFSHLHLISEWLFEYHSVSVTLIR